MFIRQHAVFEENFSVGVRVLKSSDQEGFDLIRCNSPHLSKSKPWHNGCHIHLNGLGRLHHGAKKVGDGVISEEFFSVNSALRYLTMYLNIVNGEILFDSGNENQLGFPFRSNQ